MVAFAQTVLVAGQAAALTPSFAILGSNDLQHTNSTAALLLTDALSHKEAFDRCLSLGEQLLRASEIDDDLRGELRWHAGGASHAPLWLANDAWPRSCTSWVFGTETTWPKVCSRRLPALCTHSAPLVSAATANTHVPASRVTLRARNLTITGYRDRRAVHFLGIPFAAPPIGHLRFHPPQPYDGETEIDATLRRLPCIQPPSTLRTSEDCLYLTVWIPHVVRGAAKRSMLKPVFVTIHGGAYVEGSPSDPRYSGAELASRGDQVVVGLSYRLGPLGALAIDEQTGNQATLDQLAALRWVQDHIEAFGGDPDRVTVYGRSAGGQSVFSLLSSPMAKGLFRGAISQSAPMGLPYLTRDLYVDRISTLVATSIGCPPSTVQSIRDCLLTADASAFASFAITESGRTWVADAISRYADIPIEIAAIEPWLPIVDGRVIAGQPAVLARDGKMPVSVPLFIGHVRDEAGYYFYPIFPTPLPPSSAVLAQGLRRLLPAELANATLASSDFKLNASGSDAVRTILSDVTTAEYFSCPVLQMARSLAERSPVYAIRFDRGFSNTSGFPPECESRAVCHFSDVATTFGTFRDAELPHDSYTDDDLTFSRFVIDQYSSFVRHLDPSRVKDMTIRGPSYCRSVALAARSPLAPLASGGAIGVFDLPPRRDELRSPRCRFLDSLSYPFDRVGK